MIFTYLPFPYSPFHVHPQSSFLNSSDFFCFTCLLPSSISTSFCKKHLSPGAFQEGFQDQLGGDYWMVSLAKWLSRLPQDIFLGCWLDDSILCCWVFRMRLSAYVNLQDYTYTKNVYCRWPADMMEPFCNMELSFMDCLGQPSHLVNMPYYFICTQYMCRLLNIDQNWSTSLTFWLPCTENKCSAWHLNKTFIFEQVTNTMPH